MKQYINRDLLVGFSGGGSKKEIAYPLRVGRKQKRAVLDANGIEMSIFPKGQEGLAQLTCDLLNHNHENGLPWLLDKCEKYQQRWIDSESFIFELLEMSFFKRAFSYGKILNFLKSLDKYKF